MSRLKTPYNIGDRVATKFSGRRTEHAITRIKFCRNSQSGVMYDVDPPIPGNRDDDNPHFDGAVDHGWFERVEVNGELFA